MPDLSTPVAARTAAFIALAFAEDTLRPELSFEQFSKSVPLANDTIWTGARLAGVAFVTASTDPLLLAAGPLAAAGVALACQRPEAVNVEAVVTLTSEAGGQLHLVANRDTGTFSRAAEPGRWRSGAAPVGSRGSRAPVTTT